MTITRRRALALSGSALAMPYVGSAFAQSKPIRIGLLLPYSGTFAQLGEAITRAIELYAKENKAKFGGREVQFVKLDDLSDPPKATEFTNKLVLGEKVDALMGTVHSGVALAMVRIAKEAGLPTIVPNAGADDITGGLCAPNVFRSSFSNSQVGFATGQAMLARGIKEAVTYSWRYAAGQESVNGFKESFTAGGGKIVKELWLPFPDVEFQAGLSEIASLRPPAVYSFFAGGGAAKYIRDYAGAGLNKSIQLWGPGFLTDGVEKAVGAAGNGVKTVLHYADDVDNAENKAFRAAFRDAYKTEADVYAVQGWDAMQLLAIGLQAAGGDISKRKEMFDAMRKASFASPRGPFKLSNGQNPVQNFYLRELNDGANKLLGVAAKDLAETNKACRMT